MRHPLTRVGPVLWALCACLLLLPRAAAAADPSLTVDFDGDGLHDSVRLDQRRPSVLRVWLSASGTMQVLVSRRPLHRVAATDLDGDHRPELIASDSQARIHVWTPGSEGFFRYRPRQSIPNGLSKPTGHRVDGHGRDPEEAFSGGAFTPPELTRTPPAAPPDRASVICPPLDERPGLASSSADPFSPRPPPA